ncbi:MAG TPA: TonB-dependent receptor [Anaeromyxobacteraceae bacterium]|nr:TonB-dependent receptor [Anaeromyxobacteraceae bacterium]
MASTPSIPDLTLALLIAALPGGTALAQQVPPGAPAASEAPPAAAEPRKAAEEEILVTGSRIRRKDLTTPAPVAVLSREDLQASGKVTLGEFLQTLPEQGNAPNFQLNNGGATYDADGATRVNLRSLGVSRTLVLLNGRRLPSSGFGANSASPDLNTIPTAAVERIEVLKDGASAVYGSDAIGGVVNVITRKDYAGTEASAQAGVSSRGDAQTYDVQVTTGRTTDSGSLLFSVGYFDQKSSWLKDRKWSAYALTWDYASRAALPGGSYRTPQGDIGLPPGADTNPACTGNPVCNALVTNDPSWANDAFIRDLAFPATDPRGWRVMTGADTYNYATENYLTIPSTRVQAFSSGDTRLGPVRGYYEMSFVQSQTQQNAAPFPLNPSDYSLPGSSTPISVSASSMYNPFGVDLPFAGRRLVEFGHRTYSQDMETFRVVTGLDGTLSDAFGPLRGWYWDGSLNYGNTGGTFTTGGAIRNSKIADAVGPSMLVNGVPTCVSVPGDPSTAIPGCVPLNLFGGPNNGSIDPAQIANLGFTGTSRARFQLLSVSLNAAGELFSISAERPVSLAAGYEHRQQSGAQIADPIAASGDSADFNFKSTRGSYSSNEIYAELQVPILSGVVGAHVLEASAAARFVHYSTFGSNTSYKLGARWAPIRDVTLRGTYSTAFRAPSINELYLGQSETAPVASDPCNYAPTAPQALKDQCAANGAPAPTGDNGNQELAHVGGNSALKAETARILTAGVVVEPQMVRGLSLTIDYYQTAVDHLVGTIGVPAIIAGCFPAAYNSTAAPYQPYCDLITRASTSGRILYVTDVNQNVGKLRTSGVDVGVRYSLPTGAGRFRFGLDGTWLSKFDRIADLATGALTIHGKGNYDLGAMPEWKANLSALWALGPWSAGTVIRYVGSFKECGAFSSDSGTYQSTGGLCYADPAAPSRQVGSNVVVDLHAGYALSSVAGKTSVALGVSNVFDQAPQYVYAAALANSDPSVYDYLGRYYYLRLQHSF